MQRLVACWKVANSSATIPNKETAKESTRMFPHAIKSSVWARNVRDHRRTREPPRTAKICCTGVSKLSKHSTSDLEQEKKPGAISRYVSRISPSRRVHGRCYISSASQHVCAFASLRRHALGSLQHTIHVVEHVHGPLSKLRDYASS